MLELQGKFGTAKVFTDVVDNESISQVINLLNQPYIEGSKVRMMPDIHAGAGCTIGTTMTIKDKICPNLVGVDIGCGMETIRIKETHIEPQKLDKVIRAGVPSGFEIRTEAHRYASSIDLSELYCAKMVNVDRAYKSIGTLGGGNHFIEANKDDDGHKGDSPKDESFNIPTSDGKTVRVNIEFSYRFDEARVSETFAMFKGKSGEAIKDSFIKPKVVAWTQEVSANYPVTDIFGDKRTEINAELDTYLREKFDQYGIIIDTVNFTDISVDDETAAAIQKKVTAQQELELANIEKQTAKVQAEKDREVAQINAEKAVIEAEAKAETLRIAAEAEADANRKIAASLTNELIEKIKYEQWNGELPTVTGSTPIISLEP